jgi:hypothetical protein
VEEGTSLNNVEILLVIKGRGSMTLKIHSDFYKANLDEMKEIYTSVGWTKHTKEIIKQVFETSNVFMVIHPNKKCIRLFGCILNYSM